MKRSKTLEDKIREHNHRVKSEFERAHNGEIICLTDLMISQEEIIMDQTENEKLKNEIFQKKGSGQDEKSS